jgi:predicted RND superfamily exporter protein
MGATTAAGILQLPQLDVPRILGFAFGLIIAILNVAFGSLVGGQLGLMIVLAGILAGCGITVAFAASIALGQNQPTQ